MELDDKQSQHAPHIDSRDPFAVRIHEEVEEFLRDLALEFPFEEVFESLRRFEYNELYGSKVIPLPRKGSPAHSDNGRDVDSRVKAFLDRLEEEFGQKHGSTIQESFRYFSSTTRD